jgi:hypothetical protein
VEATGRAKLSPVRVPADLRATLVTVPEQVPADLRATLVAVPEQVPAGLRATLVAVPEQVPAGLRATPVTVPEQVPAGLRATPVTVPEQVPVGLRVTPVTVPERARAKYKSRYVRLIQKRTFATTVGMFTLCHNRKSSLLSEGTGIGIALVSPRGHAMKLPRRKFLHLAVGAARRPAREGARLSGAAGGQDSNCFHWRRRSRCAWAGQKLCSPGRQRHRNNLRYGGIGAEAYPIAP